MFAEFTLSILEDLSEGRSPSIFIQLFRIYCTNLDSIWFEIIFTFFSFLNLYFLLFSFYAILSNLNLSFNENICELFRKFSLIWIIFLREKKKKGRLNTLLVLYAAVAGLISLVDMKFLHFRRKAMSIELVVKLKKLLTFRFPGSFFFLSIFESGRILFLGFNLFRCVIEGVTDSSTTSSRKQTCVKERDILHASSNIFRSNFVSALKDLLVWIRGQWHVYTLFLLLYCFWWQFAFALIFASSEDSDDNSF